MFLNLVYFCDTFIEQFWLQESLEAIFLEIKSVLLYLLQRSPDDPAFLVIKTYFKNMFTVPVLRIHPLSKEWVMK